MKRNLRVLPLVVSIAAACTLPPVSAAGGGFIKDSSATLQFRNYYFSRDFSDIVGPNKQSKAEEWAQGFILNFASGYTPGPVGFGLDVVGLLGVKLDSDRRHTNTGLLPVHGDGEAADEYSRIGPALKARVSKTELKVGELQPNLPVLIFSDNRLLPPTYQGASLVSAEIPGLTLQAGQFRSTSLRNSTNDQEMYALINDPINPRRIVSVTSDRFNYVGADYRFNRDRTSVGIWQAQLKDIYRQRFYGLKHFQTLGSWGLGANLGYFTAEDDGKSLGGDLDNQALFALLSARHGGHTLYVGYQAMYGRNGFLRVGDNISPLGNEVPTFEFAAPHERSWQLRHDFDFAVLGLPGLTSTLRYIRGDNVESGRGFEGRDWERDLDLAYTVQSGPLRNLSLRLRNVTARSNYRTDIDENRLILSYTLKLR